ncbi:NAD-dependent epimerase/dehydratase family protein [Saccharopolyspora erythraea]|uniref:NAD-dependent epimerase/dehydratase family protein n=1 Tax=Saccharopolyspora erythraea TaxID=1836 RepID=UPI001BA79F09|nr:NAD-dependent epimerase/dehydratase family protein [Saccharopolyspora erythraea]QUH02204.1 NAD-dependent epimerase/dehydratase family protein [Saccharopolyspora erythraea]
MSLHVVVGKGPVGTATAELLADRGHAVRVISRSGGPATSRADGSIEQVALDASDSARLAEACEGAVAVYGCAAPPYHRWVEDWPPLSAALLDAAERSGAVLVLAGNLYAYGPTEAVLTEDLPAAANTRKGQVRARVWQDALQRHEAGRVRVTEARASDFVGPGVTAGGHLAERALPALLKGRPVRVLGDPDAQHSWTYVPDIARTLVRLAEEERAWGRVWHVPTPPPYSARSAIESMCRIADVAPVRVAATPWAMVRLGGLVSPLLRELVEIRYQFDEPFVVDTSAYTDTFGEQATPAKDALAATVTWWRERLAARS